MSYSNKIWINIGSGNDWRQQAIIWTITDISWKVFPGIHLNAISQQMLKNIIHNMGLEITL